MRNDSSEKRGICQRSGNDTTEDTEVTVFVNLDNPDEKLKVMTEEELSAGGAGIRYTCRILGVQCYLFYEENNRWFMEGK